MVGSHDRGDGTVAKRELVVSPKIVRERKPRRQASREAQDFPASIASSPGEQYSAAKSYRTGQLSPSTISLRVYFDSCSGWRVDLPMRSGGEAVLLRDVVHSYLDRVAAGKFGRSQKGNATGEVAIARR